MCVCVCVLYVPEGAEMVESYDWFPGTMRPCALGRMSGGRRGGGGGRQTENISRCDNNYREAICDKKRNVMQISLVQSAVLIFHQTTKRRETLCHRSCLN